MKTNVTFALGGILLALQLGACRVPEAHAGIEADMGRPSILDAGATRKPRESPRPPESPVPLGPTAPTSPGR